MAIDLFGNDTPMPKGEGTRRAEEQHKVLISLYGKCGGEKCGDCKNLIRKHFSKVYLKCSLSRQSNGTATDWRAGWEACGKFEKSK